MIDKAYVMTMTRYNAWQNRQIMDIVTTLKKAELTKDRGAFFGSIFATLNHVLWGDTLWMCRWCADVAAPQAGATGGTDYTKTIGDWQAERFRLDGRMRIWAETLSNVDLLGELTWFSGLQGREVSQQRALCITHMFNHQTHHRGQIHAMLTAMGRDAPVTDLVFMPEDA